MRLALLALFVACSGSSPSKPAVTPIATDPIDAPAAASDAIPFQIDYSEAEKAAYLRAKPVFAKHCARCHKKGSRGATRDSLDSLDISTYPFTGKHTKVVGDAIRDVLGQSGIDPTMPKDKKGSVTGDDLALILAWSDAWARARKDNAREPQ